MISSQIILLFACKYYKSPTNYIIYYINYIKLLIIINSTMKCECNIYIITIISNIT